MSTINQKVKNQHFTINEVAKLFGVSRSTLLYYDQKNLLIPSERNAANYRLYTAQDIERLKKIFVYRNAGLSTQKITEILDESSTNQSVDILEQQLVKINSDIAKLRNQQNMLLSLLDKPSIFRETRVMTKQKWTEILKNAGFNDNDMMQWHIEFERLMPEAHQDFLESLNITDSEIKQIRQLSLPNINGPR